MVRFFVMRPPLRTMAMTSRLADEAISVGGLFRLFLRSGCIVRRQGHRSVNVRLLHLHDRAWTDTLFTFGLGSYPKVLNAEHDWNMEHCAGGGGIYPLFYLFTDVTSHIRVALSSSIEKYSVPL